MTRTYAPILSRGARAAAAIGVAALVAAACFAAGHESQKAVLIASTEIYGPTYVTLPTVEIVAHRTNNSNDTAWASL